MRLLLTLIIFVVPMIHVHAEEERITRAEGLNLLWEPLKRAMQDANEAPFTDVSEAHPHFALITFAKARGIVEDDEYFSPDEPLQLKDALLWLLRSRNTAKWSALTPQAVSAHARRHGLLQIYAGTRDRRELRNILTTNPPLTRDELTALMTTLDTALASEKHIVSYYGNNFAGRRTAFGEVFDPGAMTAAHRTLPHNTLVKLTNTANNRSVVVRINDRGPYVTGRDMDLSRAAFEHLSPIGTGVLSGVSFERLGSSDIVEQRQKSSGGWHERHVERRSTRRARRK